METTTDTTLVAFKAICNFIKDLNFAFGDRLPPLQLYAHLLDKTGLLNEEPIRKHVGLFQRFIDEKEEAILQQSVSLLQDNPIIRYSDRVYINLNAILQLSEPDDITTLWTHLLTITAILRPQSAAKDILRQYRQRQLVRASQEEPEVLPPPAVVGSGEASSGSLNRTETPSPDPLQGIGNLIQTLFSGLGGEGAGGGGVDTQNPMDMVSSIMTSPAFSGILQNLNEGDLDMPKIMEGMQKTLSTLQTVLEQSTPTRPSAQGSDRDGV